MCLAFDFLLDFLADLCHAFDLLLDFLADLCHAFDLLLDFFADFCHAFDLLLDFFADLCHAFDNINAKLIYNIPYQMFQACRSVYFVENSIICGMLLQCNMHPCR